MIISPQEHFDSTSRPSEIRLVSGLYDNSKFWRLWLCTDNSIMLAPAAIEAIDLQEYGKDVTFTLILPSNIIIDAGLGEDMYFISILRAHQHTQLDDLQYARVINYFKVILAAMKDPCGSIGDEEIRFTSMALVNLCRKSFDQRDALADNSRQAHIANEFIKLVSQNCQKERNMSFYADRLAIASKYLSFVVSSRTGRTGAEWIKEYTMAKAKELLLKTNLSVSEISDQLNFITSSDFCKWFRRGCGLSPKEFRNRIVSDQS